MSERLDKAIAVGLLLALVVTALTQGAVEPWSAALFEFIVIGLMLLWGIKAVVDESLEITIPTTALPLAALVALALAQSIAFTDAAGHRASLSLNVESTRAAVTVLIFLFVCFIIASNFFTTRERLRGLANFLTIYGLAVAMFALIQHFTWDGRFYWLRLTTGAAFGPFVNRNHFAGYMELLIPIPLALIVSRSAREWRLIYGFAAVLMGTAAVMSESRAGMLSLIAEIVFIVALSRQVLQTGPTAHRNRDLAQKVPRLWVRAGAVAVVVAAITVSVIWIGANPIIERLASTYDELMSTGSDPEFSRPSIWSGTVSMIRANPLVGIGFGAFKTAYPIYSRDDLTALVSESHNDYLQVLADCGIVGGMLALWFIVSVFRAVVRGTRSRDPLLRGLALASGAGVFGMLVHSLFDFNLQIPSNALLFLFLSAVASSVGAIRVSRDVEPVRRSVPEAVAFAARRPL
jgi:O-antigen ligase